MKLLFGSLVLVYCLCRIWRWRRRKRYAEECMRLVRTARAAKNKEPLWP